MTELSDQQREALAKIDQWFNYYDSDPRPFFLAGAAGTGKTTLAKHLNSLGDVVYGAYTGKAAHVLRSKGVPASTIHSAIYRPVDNYEVRAKRAAILGEIAAIQSSGVWDTEPGARREIERLTAEIEALESALKRPTFELNPGCEWAGADLIVLDEVSMVNETMAHDIESFGVPVLVLGDIAQLPPVEGGGYYTRRTPDFELTEVHRQALDSPVYALATDIRKGVPWPRVKVSLDAAMRADQIIVWKNSTRWNLTAKIREKLGRPACAPVPGDRVMCLVNNKKDLGIFNGQQFEVLAVQGNTFELMDDDGIRRWFEFYPEGFCGLDGEKEMKEKRRAWRGGVGAFTFAQVITCHKAQGSEWPSVYVVDQTAQMRSDQQRWMYTATTRASESVTIAATGVR